MRKTHTSFFVLLLSALSLFVFCGTSLWAQAADHPRPVIYEIQGIDGSTQIETFFLTGETEAADKNYKKKQWLLSKWEVVEGVEWTDEKIQIMAETIKEGLSLKKTDSLVDIGCGGGWILNLMKQYVSCIVGLDFSLSMLTHAQGAFPDDHFVSGGIGELPFKEESWDCVLSYFVFLNFMDDDFVEKGLLDLYRILKKGGRALIGQLPDRNCSGDYDKSKEEYIQYCQKEYNMGKSNRDLCRAPQKLFNKNLLEKVLKANNISYQFQPSFNPFYRPGESKTVDWRFDLILIKN